MESGQSEATEREGDEARDRDMGSGRPAPEEAWDRPNEEGRTTAVGTGLDGAWNKCREEGGL